MGRREKVSFYICATSWHSALMVWGIECGVFPFAVVSRACVRYPPMCPPWHCESAGEFSVL